MEIETVGILVYAKKSLDVATALVDHARWINGVRIGGQEEDKILEILDKLYEAKNELFRFIQTNNRQTINN